MARKNNARLEFQTAAEKLKEFCEENTTLSCWINSDSYPCTVQFVPSAQQSFFSNENITSDGEINDLTVTVGLTTSVKSTLRFRMNAKLLKKLIKMAENVGNLYYHAFREAADADRDAEQEENDGNTV